MKKKIKILSTLLAVLLALSCGVGCKSGDISSTDAPPVNNEEGFKGIHNLSAPDTDKFLVQNGRCDYVLVTPEEESAKIREAKNEFLYFYKRATGITLKAIKDTGLT